MVSRKYVAVLCNGGDHGDGDISPKHNLDQCVQSGVVFWNEISVCATYHCGHGHKRGGDEEALLFVSYRLSKSAGEHDEPADHGQGDGGEQDEVEYVDGKADAPEAWELERLRYYQKGQCSSAHRPRVPSPSKVFYAMPQWYLGARSIGWCCEKPSVLRLLLLLDQLLEVRVGTHGGRDLPLLVVDPRLPLTYRRACRVSPVGIPAWLLPRRCTRHHRRSVGLEPTLPRDIWPAE